MDTDTVARVQTWIIGRIFATPEPADLAEAQAIQQGLSITLVFNSTYHKPTAVSNLAGQDVVAILIPYSYQARISSERCMYRPSCAWH